jgi:hypothetical protein
VRYAVARPRAVALRGLRDRDEPGFLGGIDEAAFAVALPESVDAAAIEHAILAILAPLIEVELAVVVVVDDRERHRRADVVGGAILARLGFLEAAATVVEQDLGAQAVVAAFDVIKTAAPIEALPVRLDAPDRVLIAVIVEIGEVEIVRDIGPLLGLGLVGLAVLADGHVADLRERDAVLLEGDEALALFAEEETLPVEHDVEVAVAVEVGEDHALAADFAEAGLGGHVGKERWSAFAGLRPCSCGQKRQRDAAGGEARGERRKRLSASSHEPKDSAAVD